MTGPVQVLVVGFDQPRFSGEVLAEFVRLREAGIVRLVDLLLISRTKDGTIETLEAPEALAADLGGLAAELLSQPDGAEGERAELPGRGVAVELPHGAEGVTQIVLLAGGPAVGVAVVLLCVPPEGQDHLADRQRRRFAHGW